MKIFKNHDKTYLNLENIDMICAENSEIVFYLTGYEEPTLLLPGWKLQEDFEDYLKDFLPETIAETFVDILLKIIQVEKFVDYKQIKKYTMQDLEFLKEAKNDNNNS